MNFISLTIRTTFWLIMAAFCGFVLVFSAIFLYLGPSLPSVDTLKTIKLQTPLRIYTSDNKLIDEFGEVRRTPIRFDQIPSQFVQALIAVEDRRFETHIGVDPKGFSRAMLQFLASGRKGGGGSTLTQQVAKNYFLSNEKLFTRKFREILLAIQMERILSKQEIFELYINKNFWGHRAYGIQAAAQVYYGRDINDLTLTELAMLAGIPQRPSRANPLSYPKAALKRRNQVLIDMHELGYITEATYYRAYQAPLTAGYYGNNPEISAPWVGEMVREEMFERYGADAYNEGYRVYTTVNSRLQNSANNAVRDGLLAYDERHGFRGAYRKLSIDDAFVIDHEAEEKLADEKLLSALSEEAIIEVEPDSEITEQEQAMLDLRYQEMTESWKDSLQTELSYGGLRVAAVLDNRGQQIIALLSDGSEININWEEIKWASRYLDASNTGPSPEKSRDIVQQGDVIWVNQIDDVWHLSQIPAAQAGLVSLNSKNGAIESLVGGFDFKQSKYNRITQAKRQPGSNIKPFMYAAALDEGMTAATIMNDAPITLVDPVLETTWRPKNSGYIFDGPIRLREALYRSKNVVSIRLLQQIGVGRTIRYLEKFGINPDDLPKNLTLALGSGSVTPLSIAEGYTVLANGGFKVNPFLIQRIEDRDGNIIFEANPAEVCLRCIEQENLNDAEQALLDQLEEELVSEPIIETPIDLINDQLAVEDKSINSRTNYAPQVIDPQVAYVMNSILRDVVKKGTGRRALVLNRDDLAGKTGTTNDGNDAWFTGFNANVVTSAWVGFDQPATLGAREWGGSAALPIWIDYMGDALKGKPEAIMAQPENMVTVRIDPATGLLASPSQQNAIFEIFPDHLAPQEYATESVPDLLFGAEDNESAIEEDTPELLF